ncbi:hypothetical protein BZY51_09490 [Enterobacter hormaechei]|nr:hypothetical protein BZY51_09490 [Enterobacter hormaechei]
MAGRDGRTVQPRLTFVMPGGGFALPGLRSINIRVLHHRQDNGIFHLSFWSDNHRYRFSLPEEWLQKTHRFIFIRIISIASRPGKAKPPPGNVLNDTS